MGWRLEEAADDRRVGQQAAGGSGQEAREVGRRIDCYRDIILIIFLFLEVNIRNP